jgi:hypothetical protein
VTKKYDITDFFIGWTILEFGLSFVLLLLFLPETIKINFGFILTSQPTSGSKFNILALPVSMLVASGGLKYSSRYFNPVLKYLFIFLNVIVLIGTSFFLIQLFIMR